MAGQRSGGRRRRAAGDEGMASLELVLLLPVLMLLALFVMWAGRGGRAALIADLAAEEAATAAALACEQHDKTGCEDLVVNLLSSRSGLDFLCIGGARPNRPDGLVEQEWLYFDPRGPDRDLGTPVDNPEARGVTVVAVDFVCETDGAVAPLLGVFPTVTFHGQASEVSIAQGPPRARVTDVAEEEDVGDMTFTVNLDAPPTENAQLTWSVMHQTTEDADFNGPLSGQVDIVGGNNSPLEIKVPILDDALFEADEVFELHLSVNPATALVLARNVALGTIEDNDNPPTVTVTDTAVTEDGGTQLMFVVDISGPIGQPLVVAYDTADDTTAGANRATDGSACPSPVPTTRLQPPHVDYVRQSGGRLTFLPKATSQQETIIIDHCSDLVGEPLEETFKLNWRVDHAHPLASSGAATGTIRDDEPRIRLVDTCVGADDIHDEYYACGREDAGPIAFTVERTPDQYGNDVHVTFRFRTAEEAAPGRSLASQGTDYTAWPPGGVVVCSSSSGELGGWPPPLPVTNSNRRLDIAVGIAADSLHERDESFVLELCAPSDNAWVDTPKGFGRIDNDDELPRLLISDARVEEAAGNMLEFEVELVDQSGLDASFEYRTEDGTATAGDDYVAVQQTSPPTLVTFPAGDPGGTTKTVQVEVRDDSLYEGTVGETVRLRLLPYDARFEDTSGSCAAESQDPVTLVWANRDNACALGVIEDNDKPPLVRLADAALSPVVEGRTAKFDVYLHDPNTPSQRITSGQPVELDWEVVHRETVDADFPMSSVLPPRRLTSGTLVIPAGQSSGQIDVGTYDDLLYEGGSLDVEDFEIRLTGVTGAEPLTQVLATTVCTAGVADDNCAVGGIEDNDDPPVVRVREQPVNGVDGVGASAQEGTASGPAAGVLKFVVELVDSSGKRVVSGREARVAVSTGLVQAADVPAGHDAAAADDFVALSDTVVIPPGGSVLTGDGEAEVDVLVEADDVDERDEVLSLVLSSPVSGAQLGPDVSALGVIRDDDTTVVSVTDTCTETGPPPSVAACAPEGSDVVFKLVLDRKSSRKVEVDYLVSFLSLPPGAVADSDDFPVVAWGTAEFDVGVTAVNVPVSTSDDTHYENHERFKLQLEAPTVGTLANNGWLGAILNDDDLPILEIDDADAVQEGEDAQFTVRLVDADGDPAPSVDDATFTWSLSYEGYTTKEDFKILSDSFTIPAGTDTTATPTRIPVPTDPDDIYEGGSDETESFELRISGLAGARQTETATDPCTAQTATSGGRDSCALGRITDDDDPPVVRVREEQVNGVDGVGASAQEGTAGESEAGVLEFVVELVDSSDNRVVSGREAQVPVSTGLVRGAGVPDGHDAAAADDFVARPSRQVVIPAGGSVASGGGEVQVDVSAVADDDGELDEVLSLVLGPESSLSGAKLGADRSALGLILDDDEGLPVITVVANHACEVDLAMTFTINLDRASGADPSTETVTVEYATADGDHADDNHNALAGRDYTAVEGTITFGPTESTKTVSVTVFNNGYDNPPRQLLLVLSEAVNAKIADGHHRTRGELYDEEGVRIISASSAAAFEGQRISIPVLLDNPTCEEVTFRVAHFTTFGYSATYGARGDAGADYGEFDLNFDEGRAIREPNLAGDNNGRFVIPPLSDRTHVTFETYEDDAGEGSESFKVQIGAFVNAFAYAHGRGHFFLFGGGTILDPVETPDNVDDSVECVDPGNINHPVPTLEVTPDNRAVNEGTGSSIDAPFELVFSPPICEGETVSIEITRADHFDPDDTLANDQLLSDDDVRLPSPTSFTAPQGGLARQSLRFQVVGDSRAEHLEYGTWRFRYSDTMPAHYRSATPAHFALTVRDDERAGVNLAPHFSLSRLDWEGGPGILVTSEEGQFLAFVVRLLNPVDREVSVGLRTVDGAPGKPAATGGEDFEVIDQRVTFQPGESIKEIVVPLYENDDDGDPGTEDPDEYFTVQVYDPDSGLKIYGFWSIYVKIAPLPWATLDAYDVTVTEGGDVESMVIRYRRGSEVRTSFDIACSRGLRVVESVESVESCEDDDETSDWDDDEASDWLATIGAGDRFGPDGSATGSGAPCPASDDSTYNVVDVPGLQSSARIFSELPRPDNLPTVGINLFVRPCEDDLYEGDEIIEIRLDDVVRARVGDRIARITIKDNEKPPELSAPRVTSKERRFVNLDISLAATPGRERNATVEWTTSDRPGDAEAGEDYVFAKGHLVFEPGETTKTITITILEDSEVEKDERIWIQFSNPVNMAFDKDIRLFNNRTSIIIEDND